MNGDEVGGLHSNAGEKDQNQDDVGAGHQHVIHSRLRQRYLCIHDLDGLE